jgi:hypothetical protein
MWSIVINIGIYVSSNYRPRTIILKLSQPLLDLLTPSIENNRVAERVQRFGFGLSRDTTQPSPTSRVHALCTVMYIWYWLLVLSVPQSARLQWGLSCGIHMSIARILSNSCLMWPRDCFSIDSARPRPLTLPGSIKACFFLFPWPGDRSRLKTANAIRIIMKRCQVGRGCVTLVSVLVLTLTLALALVPFIHYFFLPFIISFCLS